ncbi:hypothetical protein PENTCL1PPCAC_3565, partial [Pristionchus entomophagus]
HDVHQGIVVEHDGVRAGETVACESSHKAPARGVGVVREHTGFHDQARCTLKAWFYSWHASGPCWVTGMDWLHGRREKQQEEGQHQKS